MERIENKTDFAYQAVSHCNAESERDYLSLTLRQLMPLTLAGRCFNDTKWFNNPNWDYQKKELGENC